MHIFTYNHMGAFKSDISQCHPPLHTTEEKHTCCYALHTFSSANKFHVKPNTSAELTKDVKSAVNSGQHAH